MLTGDKCMVQISPNQYRRATFIAANHIKALVVFEKSRIEAKVPLPAVFDIDGHSIYEDTLRPEQPKPSKSLRPKCAVS